MKTRPLCLCGSSNRGRSHGTLIPTSLAVSLESALRHRNHGGLKQPLDFVVPTPGDPLASPQRKNMPDHKPHPWKARDETVCSPRGAGRVLAVGRERGQARVLLAWEGSRQRGARCAPPARFRWDSKKPCLKQHFWVLFFCYSNSWAGRRGEGLLTGLQHRQLFSASAGEAEVQMFPVRLSLFCDIFSLQEAL